MYRVELLPKVVKWVSKLENSHAENVFSLLKMLEKFGHKLRMPIVRKIEKDLYELRDMDYGYRVYYTYKGDLLYIAVLGGDKTSQKRDIKKAKKIIKDIHKLN